MAFLTPVLDQLNPARAVKRTDREPEAQEALDQITENLTLYHFRTCPFCLRVRKAIDQLALNIEIKDIKRDHEARDELITGGGNPRCLACGSIRVKAVLVPAIVRKAVT